MKASKKFLSALIISAAVSAPAFAGPPVSVTFKNLGTTNATYKVITNNEALTKANALTTPRETIIPNGVDTYVIQSNQTPLVNFAHLRYTIGGKTCVFLATYVAGPGPLGSQIPKWNNTATPSGGATCTAKVTTTNFTTHAWSVEFTMK